MARQNDFHVLFVRFGNQLDYVFFRTEQFQIDHVYHAAPDRETVQFKIAVQAQLALAALFFSAEGEQQGLFIKAFDFGQ